MNLFKNATFLDVALPIPLRTTFEYSANTDTCPKDHLRPGHRVVVPFGSRTLIGVITNTHETAKTPAEKIKPIIDALDQRQLLSQEHLSLCEWAANYYIHPIGEVIFASLPTLLRKEKSQPQESAWQLTTEGKGLSESSLKRSPKQKEVIKHLLSTPILRATEVNIQQFSQAAIKSLEQKHLIEKIQISTNTTAPIFKEETLLKEPHKNLNQEQKSAYEKITTHTYNCALLNGVTGSGKTEVYLQLIHKILLTGQSALVLVPEIGLTHQTITRLKNRFNTPIIELHSLISEKQRALNWLIASRGDAKIIIGTRLASLTPIPNLGLIIVDEEHDTSYKQQDGFKYSARDIGVYRANKKNLPIVLASATPSLESRNNCKNQRYQELILSSRAGNAKPPKVVIQDIKNQSLSAGLSFNTLERVKDALIQKQQVMIFINRRGYAPVIQCHSCGWLGECRSCANGMTLHKHPPHLHCHHCDRQQAIPRQCPSCNHSELKTHGLGTEQIEEQLAHVIPKTDIIRFDRDAIAQKGSLAEKLKRVNEGAPCVLIGTQMLAKGHHIPKLSTVVIADTDQGLFSADFRASERMGQLITQVAGRAGRESTQGHVIIQTHYPDHPLLQQLSQLNYSTFSNTLLQERHFSNMPPHWHLVIIRAESKRAEIAIELLTSAKNILCQIQPAQPNLHYIGPVPDNMEKVNDRYRFVLQIKSQNRKGLHELIKEGVKQIDQLALSKRTRWSVDIDPI